MRVRAINAAGDWTYGAGLNNYAVSTGAAKQAIDTRLTSFLGDCFFALSSGIDWFNLLGQKNQLAIQLAVSAAILNTQSQGQSVVTGIIGLSLNLNHTTRVFTITYQAATIFGVVSSSVDTVGV